MHPGYASFPDVVPNLLPIVFRYPEADEAVQRDRYGEARYRQHRRGIALQPIVLENGQDRPAVNVGNALVGETGGRRENAAEDGGKQNGRSPHAFSISRSESGVHE